MRHPWLATALLLALALPAAAAPPDYAAWNQLLQRYYDPAKGMDYKALKAKDKAALDQLRRQLSTVDVAALSRDDQLAYWINLYNVNVVGVVVDNYPVESIRDISTDPIVRLNVFKKDSVATKMGRISLNDVEHERIRAVFKDPRIHFAINCAAASCPPIRSEAYAGSRLDAQLDDQTRRFLNGPHGVRLTRKGDTLKVYTTKIMDWFGEDFDQWGGGRLAFLRKYLSPERQKALDAAGGKVELEYQDYSWDLNDWRR
jgi:hypothetical protein